MAADVTVEDVTLQGIMKGVMFTNVALNRETTKPVPNVKNFPVQLL